VSIDAQGDRHIGVAEHFAYHLDVDAARQEERCGDVAQVVEVDAPQVGGAHERRGSRRLRTCAGRANAGTGDTAAVALAAKAWYCSADDRAGGRTRVCEKRSKHVSKDEVLDQPRMPRTGEEVRSVREALGLTVELLAQAMPGVAAVTIASLEAHPMVFNHEIRTAVSRGLMTCAVERRKELAAAGMSPRLNAPDRAEQRLARLLQFWH